MHNFSKIGVIPPLTWKRVCVFFFNHGRNSVCVWVSHGCVGECGRVNGSESVVCFGVRMGSGAGR